MKTHIQILLLILAALTGATNLRAQGTAFSYQGRLNTADELANGLYDITFALHVTPGGANQIGSTLTNTATPVTNGLFRMVLDFGDLFPGADRWLEIRVRTNGSKSFETLSPRQKILPTPYAITAGNLSGPLAASQLTGSIPSGSISGTYGSALTLNNAANTFTGNGSGLTSLNASSVSSGSLSDSRLSANVAFLGGNQTFTGLKTFIAGEQVGSPPGTEAFRVNGSRSGNFASQVAYIENTNTSTVAVGPALRLFSTGNAVDGTLNVGNSGLGKIIAFGGSAGEVANMDTNGSFFFGSNTRQMLNLWSTSYGIGVQNFTFYSRSDGGFAWFNKGIHTNAVENAGTGGTLLMRLSSTGDLFASRLRVSDPGQFVATFDGSHVGGTWLNLGNSAAGRTWNIISTGSGNNEGPGKLLFRDQTLGVAMTLSTDGNVGIGATSPAAKLDVDGTVRASGVISALGGLVIENRTSDPASPATGQIWLRTDLP